MKRFSSLLTAIAVLLPLSAQAVGVQAIIDGKTVVFTDVQQSTWFATYVRQAAEAGIVSGYRDVRGNPLGLFKPSASITVAEALKIASEGAGYDEQIYATRINSGVSHWASAYVSVAKAEHFPVIDDRVRLDRSATRAEVAAMMAAAFHVSTDNVVSDARYNDVNSAMIYSGAIEALSQDNVVSGDTDANGLSTRTFRPTDPINRAEVAKMIIAARAQYGEPGQGRMPSENSTSSQSGQIIVTYNDSGFNPAVLRVKLGDQVTFRNESSGQLWVMSDMNSSTGMMTLSGFNEGHASAAGELYLYTFNKVGSFGYHNQLNSSMKATIIVE